MGSLCICAGDTKVPFFEVLYGREAPFPIKVNLYAYRLAKRNDLSIALYEELMVDNIDKVTIE